MSTPVYDKSKCKAALWKGYTGCQCSYCDEYANSGKEWKVSVKGDRECGEISIVLDTNRHGLASYGWFDAHKILIFSCNEWQQGVPEDIWLEQIAIAKKYCAKKNKSSLGK